jgi:hypothetical protein
MNLVELHSVIKRDGIIFLSYGGFLSQALIAAMTENLEKEAIDSDLSVRLSNNIFTIFIEMAQNMMRYTAEHKAVSPRSDALIIVGKDKSGSYFVISRNVIANADADTIEKRLAVLQTLDKEQIRKKYRELRRSGQNSHETGAGIGFYEVAKGAEKIEYEIAPVSDHTSFFIFKAIVGAK